MRPSSLYFSQFVKHSKAQNPVENIELRYTTGMMYRPLLHKAVLELRADSRQLHSQRKRNNTILFFSFVVLISKTAELIVPRIVRHPEALD